VDTVTVLPSSHFALVVACASALLTGVIHSTLEIAIAATAPHDNFFMMSSS